MSDLAVFAPRRGAAGRWRLRKAVAALAVAVGVAVGTAESTAAPAPGGHQQFVEAGRAYDQGRMKDAARLYEEVIRSGRPPMEAFFNLGNAYYREGRTGLAVLNYRKAWRLAPRDPDIGANLLSAFRAAGAAEADLSGAEVVFTRVSEQEWAIIATSAWWLTGLLLCLGILVRGYRWLLLRVAAATTVVAVVGFSGIWVWRGFERRPELVVLGGVQSALHEPLPSAPPRFPLVEGSLVRARRVRGEWAEVSSGQLTGWIRRATCAPVLLERSPN